MGTLRGVAIKHVQYIKGRPWYNRRYPTKLLGHPQLNGKTHLRKRIKVEPEDAAAFVAAVEELNAAFDSMMGTLQNVNQGVIDDAILSKKAQDYIKLKGLHQGYLSDKGDRFYGNAVDYILDEYFHEMQVHYNEEKRIGHPLEPSEIVLVQEKAWKLIHQPVTERAAHQLYSELFQRYWIDKKLTTDNKRDREDKRIRQEFLDAIGGDQLVSTSAFKQHLQKYAAQLRKPQPLPNGEEKTRSNGTITRYITTIIQPIEHHNNHSENDGDIIDITRPKVAKDKVVNRKPPLDYIEQAKLLAVLNTEASWKKLYVLLALHTGSYPSELRQLKRDSFNFSNRPAIVSVSGEGTKRKTDARQRLVPLVMNVDEIQRLVDGNALAEMTSKKPENLGIQITKVLHKVNTNLSAYSLRHTLAHNLKAKGISTDIQAELGGWEAKRSHMSESQAGYGSLGKDTNERLEERAKALSKALRHLTEYCNDDVVVTIASDDAPD